MAAASQNIGFYQRYTSVHYEALANIVEGYIVARQQPDGILTGADGS